jgi:acetylornithine deacetylase/succinyl-diaminopimelate desuccinylase-like protein
MTDVSDRIAEAQSRIDPREVVELALELGNIDSPSGSEGRAADRVFEWLQQAGLAPRRYGLHPDRYSVAATVAGGGGGFSLLFNGHLDTTLRPDAVWSAADPTDRLYRGAWLEEDMIVGDGVVNDKGPTAAFLVAAKALHDADLDLPGDVIVSAVCGEIGREPVDEYTGIDYSSKDLGTRFLVTHGVVADFALVAEGTGFGIVYAEPGMCLLKVRIRSKGPRYYTPYLPDRGRLEDSPNAIVLAAAVIERIEEWARDFQTRFSESRDGGNLIPKVSVNAIRSGYPFETTSAPQVAGLYVDAYLPPGANPLDVRDELREVLSGAGIEGDVDVTAYRPGFEAVGASRLIDGIRRQHESYFGAAPIAVGPEVSSMWRDTNALIELGIPAVSYAPRAASHARTKAIPTQSLVDAARVYAAIAIDIASQPRQPWTPLGSHLNTVSDRVGITRRPARILDSEDPPD